MRLNIDGGTEYADVFPGGIARYFRAATHAQLQDQCTPVATWNHPRMAAAGMNISYLRMSASETGRFQRTDVPGSRIRYMCILMYVWELGPVVRVCWEASCYARETRFQVVAQSTYAVYGLAGIDALSL